MKFLDVYSKPYACKINMQTTLKPILHIYQTVLGLLRVKPRTFQFDIQTSIKISHTVNNYFNSISDIYLESPSI